MTAGGNRVKATLNGVTTAYLGNYYEWSNSAYKKYYYAGAQRIALNDNGTLYWLLGDHLGSTSIAANGTTGALVSEQRYKPWGEQRYPDGASTLPTRHRFTGQIEDVEIGLYFYNARMYVLGRFISADSIVPGAASGSGGGAGTLGVDSGSRLTTLTTDFHEFIGQVTKENQAVLQYGPFFQWSEKVRKDNPAPSGPLNPQALNRYAYCLNNPLRYVDPTGHFGDVYFEITFYNEELIKYFIQAIHNEADFLTWRGQRFTDGMTAVTLAGG
jgi:RHS repeat-associated protein